MNFGFNRAAELCRDIHPKEREEELHGEAKVLLDRIKG